MRTALLSLALFLPLLGATCNYNDHDKHRNDRYDEGVGDGWRLLGRREVDFRGDRDSIEIGRDEGRFRKLRFEVRNAPIEMYNMLIVFEDGSRRNIDFRHRFSENRSSPSIDLPGDRRTVRRVEFSYRSISSREGRGSVMLYGQ